MRGGRSSVLELFAGKLGWQFTRRYQLSDRQDNTKRASDSLLRDSRNEASLNARGELSTWFPREML